ncbi:MAG: tRNA lysidine(34) synthetase TilS [Treponema sp.]|jgi:tRNA(Ile)-lysidine synthase|nr:tRNA lysidine(34) synthetase TilS [Treponema sp.]
MNGFESAMAAALHNEPPGLYVAAVSGGADSTAMLAALDALRRESGSFLLRCIHVEHGIRPPEESRGDAEAVRKRCAEMDVPCTVTVIPPGRIAALAKQRKLGIEAAARRCRYAALNREADRTGAQRILTAHTRDDLLETALMRFLQGAGPAGLAAMPPLRGRLLRPLLELSRAQVLRYLKERGIPFQTDSTNRDTAYLRNRVRHCLIPLLDERFPFWRSGVAAAAQTQALAASFMADEARRRIPWEQTGGEWSAPKEPFFAQAEIIREEALFQALDGLAPVRPPRRAAVRRFAQGECRALETGPGQDGRTRRLENRGSRIAAGPVPDGESEEGFVLLIKEPGRYKLEAAGTASGAVYIEVLTGCGGPGHGFYGVLPVVLRNAQAEDRVTAGGKRFSKAAVLAEARRSGYTGVISAEDALGVAALIGFGARGAAVLARREGVFPQTFSCFYIE